jgi:predicted transcriptional regulator
MSTLPMQVLEVDTTIRATTKPFAPVPLTVLKDENLTPADKLVYARLSLFALKTGEAWMSKYTLARECCLNPRTVQRALKKLIEAGLITRELRYQKTPIYRVLSRETFSTETNPTETKCTPNIEEDSEKKDVGCEENIISSGSNSRTTGSPLPVPGCGSGSNGNNILQDGFSSLIQTKGPEPPLQGLFDQDPDQTVLNGERSEQRAVARRKTGTGTNEHSEKLKVPPEPPVGTSKDLINRMQYIDNRIEERFGDPDELLWHREADYKRLDYIVYKKITDPHELDLVIYRWLNSKPDNMGLHQKRKQLTIGNLEDFVDKYLRSQNISPKPLEPGRLFVD